MNWAHANKSPITMENHLRLAARTFAVLSWKNKACQRALQTVPNELCQH